jgi:ribosomal protein S18 acetylase RimI-like enzyme
MSNLIGVREMQQQEKKIVQHLLFESYHQYEPLYKDPEVWFNYLKDIRSSVFNENADKILVAVRNGKIIGSLQLYQSSEKAYNKPELEIHSPIIRLLAVHPNARGCGAAQALLGASVEYAVHKGETSIYLHSSDRMHKAIKLYERYGFKRDFSKEFILNDTLVKCFRFDIKHKMDEKKGIH